jgi:hypothetical protein
MIMSFTDLKKDTLLLNSDIPLEDKLALVPTIVVELCGWKRPYAAAAKTLEFIDTLNDLNIVEAVKAEITRKANEPAGRGGKVSNV